MNPSEIVKLFLIGSFVSVIPMIYMGIAYNKLNCHQQGLMRIKYAYIPMILPLMYGLVYVVLTLALRPFISNDMLRLFVLGAIAGEIYSLIGHYIFKLPETLFLMKHPNMVHIIAPIMYAFIYGLLVYPLEKVILK